MHVAGGGRQRGGYGGHELRIAAGDMVAGGAARAAALDDAVGEGQRGAAQCPTVAVNDSVVGGHPAGSGHCGPAVAGNGDVGEREAAALAIDATAGRSVVAADQDISQLGCGIPKKHGSANRCGRVADEY